MSQNRRLHSCEEDSSAVRLFSMLMLQRQVLHFEYCVRCTEKVKIRLTMYLLHTNSSLCRGTNFLFFLQLFFTYFRLWREKLLCRKKFPKRIRKNPASRD